MMNSESSFEFNFDDDIQDPDYTVFENDDLGGILCLDSDPDDHFEPLSTTPLGLINIISESSEDDQPTSIRIGLKVLDIILCVTKQLLFLLELQAPTVTVVKNVLLMYRMTKN
ncbi:uncharacterized protein LOC126909595 [Daktulosphaira vitifoliae]|uniref:uncharacterized protein LOC126909595 n=1 Tax=Daktulosphaira vitifoliae TaxID=58002 RepID=UPI0021AAC642|nr:uncharacterized protein LOC126909595 [Daktulosphaira vitifoliae]